jgi:mannitol/fructose-specific phosphotransferase system IIA component (Ntr-type)
MNLDQFTEPTLLVPRLLSEWRDSAISKLSQHLESVGRVENASAFTHAVLYHESLVSAVFDEVAFPLARGNAVKELSFALGLSQQNASRPHGHSVCRACAGGAALSVARSYRFQLLERRNGVLRPAALY